MMTLTIPVSDATLARLQTSATESKKTVEEYVAPFLEELAHRQPLIAERQKALEALRQYVSGFADRYPPGYRADDSRESIYAGCGE